MHESEEQRAPGMPAASKESSRTSVGTKGTSSKKHCMVGPMPKEIEQRKGKSKRNDGW